MSLLLAEHCKALQSIVEYCQVLSSIVECSRVLSSRRLLWSGVVCLTTESVVGSSLMFRGSRSYDKVAKVVEPKRIALKKATSDLAEAEADLAERNAELKIVQDALAELQEDLRVTLEKKDQLEFDVKQCADRLERAEKLISGLGGEKDRWSQFVKDLQVQYDNITGDILISSGVIAYLGSFTQSYRDSAVSAWSSLLRSKNITCAESYSIIDCLGEPVEIRQWNLQKLPRDNLSISNAVRLCRMPVHALLCTVMHAC